MKKSLLLNFLTLLLFVCQTAIAQVTLSGTSYTQDFDAIASGLPNGWTVRTGAAADALGTPVALTTAATAWNNTSGAFKNFASADGLAAGSTSANQSASADRSLGVRQTGSLGDPGAAFVLQLTNTAGFEGFKMAFKLQSLDGSGTYNDNNRKATWRVDYGFGDSPTTFVDANAVGSLTTMWSTFTNQPIEVDFGSALNNQSSRVWIRIVTLNGTTGSGSRPSTGIDDVSLSYTPGNTPTISATPTSITGLNYTLNQGPSGQNTNATIGGVNLTPASGTLNLALTNPSFELQNPATSVWSSNDLAIPYTGGSLSNVQIPVRLKAGLSANTYTSQLIVTGGGADSTRINLDGRVIDPASPCGTAISIAAARAQVTNAPGPSVTISGRVTVTDQYGGMSFYMQDENGTGVNVFMANAAGFAYDGKGNFGDRLKLGDRIQIAGPIEYYQGKVEINIPTCYTKLPDVNAPVAPVAVAAIDATMYGKLVTLNGVMIDAAGDATFQGNKTYSLVGRNEKLFIDDDSELNSMSIPAGPISITGIADVYGTTSPIDQIIPRLRDDIPASTLPAVSLSYLGNGTVGGSTISRDNSFDVVTYNVEWFAKNQGANDLNNPTGTSEYGPALEYLQANNIQRTLEALNADVYVLEEVCNTAMLDRIVTRMGAGNEYAYSCGTEYFSYFFQNPESDDNPLNQAQKVCLVYKKGTVSIISKLPLLTGTPPGYNYFATPRSNNWSSGRLPYLWELDATINGVKKRIHLVGIHAKSGTTNSSDITRRTQDIIDLKAELDNQYGSANVIIAGDFNDRLSSTDTYAPFVNDAVNYNPVSKTLQDAGLKSTTSTAFNDVIDNIMFSTEIGTTTVPSGIQYIANSVATARVDGYTDAVYGDTFTDHFPTVARFTFNVESSTPVTWLDFRGKLTEKEQVELNWTTVSEKNNSHFEIQRSKDGLNFETLMSVKGSGNSTSTIRYSCIDENPGSGLNYYRLKQVDTDGAYDLSRAISIEVDALKIGPNPTTNVIKVDSKGLVEVQLYSLTGVLLKKSQTNEMHLEELPAGSYLLKIITTYSSSLRKVVKR